MSIIKAKLKDGKIVYAEQGEELRDVDVYCIDCGCKMHICRFPKNPKRAKVEYHFSRNPGQDHTSLCQDYDGRRNKAVLKNSPDDFIESLMTPDSEKPKITRGPYKITPRVENEEEEGLGNIPKVLSLAQLINTGVYSEAPYGKTIFEGDFNYIDYVILDKWACLIWKEANLPRIGRRIIDAKWVGSLVMKNDPTWQDKMIKFLKNTKELWITTFWRVGKDFKFVRFCLDCHACFAKIKQMLFENDIRDNNTFNAFKPIVDNIELLVAANWAAMSSEDCREKCPQKMCNGCNGAYWGKCINPTKQVALFAKDQKYKKNS